MRASESVPCAVAALVLACFPGVAPIARSQGAADATLEPPQQRSLALDAMPVLEIGATWLGFVATAVLLTRLPTWHAERPGLPQALTLAVACAPVGLVAFGRALGATLPETRLEQVLLALPR